VALEICVDSAESALAAQEGGADRIELCAELAAGGLTPSVGLIEACRESVTLETMLMIRPRGGDFQYTDREVAVMVRDIAHAKHAGLSGVVFGALSSSGEIDVPTVRRLRDAAGDMSITFHRAFDLTPDPLAALETLVELGIPRVLTSGQAATAYEGRELLARLVQHAAGRIVIMAGGGIGEANIQSLKAETGVREFHASARVNAIGESPKPCRMLHFGDADSPDRPRQVTSADRVRALATAIRGKSSVSGAAENQT
jgi:copper homeostasis protein